MLLKASTDYHFGVIVDAGVDESSRMISCGKWGSQEGCGVPACLFFTYLHVTCGGSSWGLLDLLLIMDAMGEMGLLLIMDAMGQTGLLLIMDAMGEMGLLRRAADLLVLHIRGCHGY